MRDDDLLSGPTATDRRFDSPVSEFIAKQLPAARAILEALRALVREVLPDAEEEMKWGTPFYSHEGLLCFAAPSRTEVKVSFMNGPKLDDPQGLLKGSGKLFRYVRVSDAKQLANPAIAALLRASAAMNAEKKRAKKGAAKKKTAVQEARAPKAKKAAVKKGAAAASAKKGTAKKGVAVKKGAVKKGSK